MPKPSSISSPCGRWCSTRPALSPRASRGSPTLSAPTALRRRRPSCPSWPPRSAVPNTRWPTRSSARRKREHCRSAAATDFQATAGGGIEAVVDGVHVSVGRSGFLESSGADVAHLASAADGLAADGKTPVFVALDGRAVAVIAVADTLKAGSVEAVAELHRLGLTVVMLTGDNRRTAEAIARSVGIDRVLADVRPDGKAAAVKALQAEGMSVAMVGRRDQRRSGPCVGRRRSCDGHRHRRGYGIGRRDPHVRRPARPRHRLRIVPGDDAEHPPEPVLGIRLQRRAHPACHGRGISVYRGPARSDHRRRRDGGFLGHGRVERAATPGVPGRDSSARDGPPSGRARWSAPGSPRSP